MSNTVTCPRCHCRLIAEEYRIHECKGKSMSVKTLGIQENYGTVTASNGDEITLIKGIDGNMYRLVKCEHKIPHNLPDQPNGNTENNQPSSKQNHF